MKKIGDFTLKEVVAICQSHEDCDGCIFRDNESYWKCIFGPWCPPNDLSDDTIMRTVKA